MGSSSSRNSNQCSPYCERLAPSIKLNPCWLLKDLSISNLFKLAASTFFIFDILLGTATWVQVMRGKEKEVGAMGLILG